MPKMPMRGCSARLTALRVRGGCSLSPGAGAAEPGACAPVEVGRVRDDNARDQQRADDDVLVLRGHLVGRERGLEAAEHRDGEDRRPAIVPRPPKIETPPSRTIVTTSSSMPDAGVVAGRREAERPQHAGEPAQRPREDEQPELDALDADPGEERRLLARADREDRAPERRRVQDDRRRRPPARRRTRSSTGCACAGSGRRRCSRGPSGSRRSCPSAGSPARCRGRASASRSSPPATAGRSA